MMRSGRKSRTAGTVDEMVAAICAYEKYCRPSGASEREAAGLGVIVTLDGDVERTREALPRVFTKGMSCGATSFFSKRALFL